MARRKRRSAEEVKSRDALGRKQCVNCAEYKHEEEFSRCLEASDGLRSHCRACDSTRLALARDSRGGWGTGVSKRLFEEDPWLYQAYRMLNKSGLRMTEANARRLLSMIPADRRCPCCGTLMVSTAGTGTGNGHHGNTRRPDSPSLEHVLPKTHQDYAKYDEWDLLRVICWGCNFALGNFTPRKLYVVADWRHDQLKALGYDDNLEARDGNSSVRHRGQRP